MSKETLYEHFYSLAVTNCCLWTANVMQKEDGMTAGFHQREARNEIGLRLKELYCQIVDGNDKKIDPYTDFLFKHYDENIVDFTNKDVSNYLNRYLVEIKDRFINNRNILENIEFNIGQTIDLIAKRNAYVDFYDFLNSISLDQKADMISLTVNFMDFIKVPKSKVENKSPGRIDWKGTQKELAELFIELKSKGWIEEIDPNLIQKAFTQSKTINQVLKVGKINKLTGKQFEQVYTSNYKAKFSEIKKNPKELKNN